MTTKSKEREQKKRNTAVGKAILLVKQALKVLKVADLEGVVFFEKGSKTREIRLWTYHRPLPYKAPPRAKIPEGTKPDILVQEKWETGTYPWRLRFLRPGGERWVIDLSYSTHLSIEGRDRKIRRVGGNFRGFATAARRAYDHDQHFQA